MDRSVNLLAGRSMRQLIALRALFVLTIVLIPLSVIVPSFIPPITVATVAHDGLNYDTRFAGSPAFEAKAFTESRTSSLQSIQFHVPFRVLKARGYSDLLQSAPLNNGVRVELSESGVLAIVIATDVAPGDTAYILTTHLTSGDWHVLDLSITNRSRLRAVLDGEVVTDTVNPDLHYDISTIAVGKGFNNDRTFDGQVRAASFSYVLANHGPQPPGWLLEDIALSSFVVNVIALVLMSDDRDPAGSRDDRPRPAWG